MLARSFLYFNHLHLCCKIPRHFRRNIRPTAFVLAFNRPNSNHVMEWHKSRLEFQINCMSLTGSEVTLQPVHHLVLPVKPTDFEKLPPKCSSCGAILQTQREGELGYVLEKKFLESVKRGNVGRLICSNCFSLNNYNKGVNLILSNGEIINQLSHLRRQKALVLYIVDLFDIEGTMIKNLHQIMGKKKRIIIVGNKVDKFPQDKSKGSKQTEHMKDILKQICYNESLQDDCNFRDICLISAKTGFGVQTLVQKIQKHRDMSMDLYLVGCANTGKSTLYNLLVNLLNVHKSNQLPTQGIVHHLPGTTNSLIREDITVRRIDRLKNRLDQEPWKEEKGFTFDDEILELLGEPTESTSPSKSKQKKREWLDNKYGKHKKENKETRVDPVRLELVNDINEEKWVNHSFVYDTPGVFNDSQLIRYLKSEEIKKLSPKKWIVPRTILMKPGKSLFMGGLARLDYVDIFRPKEDDLTETEDLNLSVHSIFVTVMMSPNVPLHVTFTEDENESVEEKFKRLFMNNVLEVPEGSAERFIEMPPFLSHDYTVIGRGRNLNASDIALHGLGWLSIAAVRDCRVQMRVSTPKGEGQTFRREPLLPYSVRLKEGRGLFYRGNYNRNMYGHTRERSKEFTRIYNKDNQTVYAWIKKIQEKKREEIRQLRETERIERLKSGEIFGRTKQLKEKEERLKLLTEIPQERLME